MTENFPDFGFGPPHRVVVANDGQRGYIDISGQVEVTEQAQLLADGPLPGMIRVRDQAKVTGQALVSVRGYGLDPAVQRFLDAFSRALDADATVPAEQKATIGQQVRDAASLGSNVTQLVTWLMTNAPLAGTAIAATIEALSK